MNGAAGRAAIAGAAGVMLGMLLGLHPVTQLLLGAAVFAVVLGLLALRAR